MCFHPNDQLLPDSLPESQCVVCTTSPGLHLVDIHVQGTNADRFRFFPKNVSARNLAKKLEAKKQVSKTHSLERGEIDISISQKNTWKL